MGADISGWVEIRDSAEASWEAAIQITYIVYRQYGMFASLFGVRNGPQGAARADGHFRAIAFGRGAPPAASSWYTQDRLDVVVGETWVLWSELAAIDWDEEGELYIGVEPPELDPEQLVFAEPGPARRRERRGDYLKGGWDTLFKLMALLAVQFGADNVRLSVWFDQW